MVREAASHFVFNQVMRSMRSIFPTVWVVLRPYISAGMLSGQAVRAPRSKGSIESLAPSLIADVTAQLRPWCRQVKVHVSLSLGREPQIGFRSSIFHPIKGA